MTCGSLFWMKRTPILVGLPLLHWIFHFKGEAMPGFMNKGLKQFEFKSWSTFKNELKEIQIFGKFQNHFYRKGKNFDMKKSHKCICGW